MAQSELRRESAQWFDSRIATVAALARDRSASKSDRRDARALLADLRRLRAAHVIDATASRAGPATGFAPAEPQRFEGFRAEPTGNAFPESRWFGSGAELLGYLEGRPGITKVLAVEPWKPEAGWQPRDDREAPPDVVERIEGLDLVREVDSDEERAALLEAIIEAWQEADDGGAFVEAEVDYEPA